MSDPEMDRKIEQLRRDLTEKLGELRRRAADAKLVLSPSTYWRSPQIRIAIGFAIGFAIGARRPAAAEVGAREGLLRAIVRTGLCAAASALVTRSLSPSRDSS
jgi:hypothetical protein